MSVDMFMKVEGASGESQDSNHKGWTDIDSFTWGATQPNTMASGGGAGAGKVSFHDLNVIAKVDKCYPAVLKHCATGKHLGQGARHDAVGLRRLHRCSQGVHANTLQGDGQGAQGEYPTIAGHAWLNHGEAGRGDR